MNETSNPIRCPEIIEKKGENKINTFNDRFDFLQKNIINLLKNDERACTDYGYMYIKIMESLGVVKIINMPKRVLSPETSNRIRRHLIEMAVYNKYLSFLMKYQKDNKMEKESREFYRKN